jgi:hypothetical protein
LYLPAAQSGFDGVTEMSGRPRRLTNLPDGLQVRPARRPGSAATKDLTGASTTLRDSGLRLNPDEEVRMAESVYRVTEIVGVSSESWEAAARAAVETAAKSVRELRVAEVVRQDLTIQDGGVLNYRVRLGISFKYDPSE